jgi:PAS domain S-box-containing protein
MEHSEDGYFEVDLKGSFVFANTAACRFAGRTFEEMIGLNYRQIMPPEQAERNFKLYNEVYRTGRPSPLIEYEIIRKDGSVAINETTVALMHDAKGEPVGFCGMVRDLTERRRLERTLAESEEKHRSILANMEEGYYETDLNGLFTAVNAATCKSLGRDEQEMRGLSFRECVDDETAQRVFEIFNQVYRTGQPAHLLECKVIRKDGAVRTHEISVSLLKNAAGQATGFFGISRDRSEQMRMEQDLRESEESYRRVLELSPDAIAINDARTERYVQVNAAFCQHIGYTPDEVIGRTSLELDIYPNPEEYHRIKAIIAKERKLDGLEVSYKDRAGNRFEDLVSARIIRFKGRSCVLFMGTVITPLKKAQEALRESEKRYRDILEAAPDPICLTTLAEGRYIAANSAFYQRSGYTPEEVIGRTALELKIYADPADRAGFLQALQKDGQLDGLEMAVRQKDGSVSTQLWSARVLDYNGQPCLLVVAKFIDDLKAAQQAVADSEESYRRIMELAPDMIVVTRAADGRIVAVNEAFCTRTGYSREEVLGRMPVDLGLYTDPENRRRWLEALHQDGQVRGMELQFRTRDGSVQDDLFSAQYIRFKGEDCVLAVITSITRIKQIQRALIESETSYRNIIESAPNAISVIRCADNRYVEVNKEFLVKTGYRRGEVIGRQVREMMVYADDTTLPLVETALREHGRVEGLEVRFRMKDGKIRDGLLYINTFLYMGEKCYLATSVDLMTVKEAQRAMRESEAGFRAIFETAADAIFVNAIDDGRFLDVNQAACHHLGYSEAELHQMTMNQILDPQSADPQPSAVLRDETAGRLFFETVHVRKDGARIPVEINRGTVERSGRLALLSIVRDVSVRKRVEAELARYQKSLERMVADRTRALEAAQEELVKRERLAVLGQLTATVSHELRNPLGVIRSSNFYLQRKAQKPDEKTLKHFRRIDEQVSLCDTIVGDLLEYTRGRSVNLVHQALDAWLPQVIEQMHEAEGITIELSMASDLPAWPHDREKLRRVVINALDNAIQAVRSQEEAASKAGDGGYRPRIAIEAERRADAVVLHIIDNGIGMDAQTCERAFEPLFTTRARGTGIGLANVKKIVDEHGGQIALESAPGSGTRMRIILPLESVQA